MGQPVTSKNANTHVWALLNFYEVRAINVIIKVALTPCVRPIQTTKKLESNVFKWGVKCKREKCWGERGRLTLNVTEPHGELRHFRDLSQNLLGHQMNATMLRPQVYLLLKPGRISLDNSGRRSHVWLATAAVGRQFERLYSAPGSRIIKRH